MENCASTDPGSRVDINEFTYPHFLLLHCSVKHLLVHILSSSMIEFKLLTGFTERFDGAFRDVAREMETHTAAKTRGFLKS